MASTFFGLTIGTGALNAANVAINTTAHNMSNVETEGYSRQRVIQSADIPLRVFSTYGMVGSGVVVHDVEQVRDFYYDCKHWNNSSVLGEYKSRSHYMNQVEDLYFSELGSNGFTDYYTDWCNALDALSSTPADLPTRNQAIQAAQSFSEYYNRIYNSLDSMQGETNVQINIVLDRINAIADNIASLNKQIDTLEMNGGSANDLRDQRNTLVDELSGYVGITVDEYTSATGASQYKIKINNQILVDGRDFRQLTVRARTKNESRHLEDVEGLYEIGWNSGISFDLYHPELSGALRGYIDIRDGDNLVRPDYPARASGIEYKGVPFYKDETNRFAKDYTREMNKLHMQGVNLYNKSTEYTPLFTVNNRSTEEILSMSQDLVSIYEILKSGTGTEMVDAYAVIEGETTTDPAVARQTVETWAYDNLGYSPAIDGDVENYITGWVEDNAVKYAMEQDPNLTHDMITDPVRQEAVTSYLYKMDADGNFIDADGNPTAVQADAAMNFMPMVDFIAENMTAQNMRVNRDIIEDNGLMATATEIDNGIDRPDVVTEMAKLRDERLFVSGTAAEYMQGLVAYSGIDAKAAKDMELNHQLISNTIINQRLSVMGVDKDEEGVDLVKYQSAYELAAKIISTMQEMYDTLIFRTGV